MEGALQPVGGGAGFLGRFVLYRTHGPPQRCLWYQCWPTFKQTKQKSARAAWEQNFTPLDRAVTM